MEYSFFDFIGASSQFVIKFIVKLASFIVFFYIALNIIMGLFNYPILASVSKQIQNSVEIHGYLPEHDYLAIKQRMDQLTYNSDHQDEIISEMEANGFYTTGLFKNLTAIVSDMHIVIYSLDSNGQADNGYTDELFYVGKSGRQHKKQQGTIMYAGIRFKYRILHPIPFLNFDLNSSYASNLKDAYLDFTEGNRNLTNFGESPFNLNYTADAAEKLEKVHDNNGYMEGGVTEIDTFKMYEAQDIPFRGQKTGSLFINPVVTQLFYSDLAQEANYTDEDR